ncbi:MAG: DUF1549 domain-containing protein, partial [Planctomycetia bacterium]|nr:DUF1549 domain-containing protein [Planctomycetia bacterium]
MSIAPPNRRRAAGGAKLLSLVCAFLCLAAFPAWAAEPDDKVPFTQVRSVFAKNCFACHGPDSDARQAGLRLDVREVATSKLESGAIPIVPGNPAASELFRRISSTDPEVRMPPADSGHDLKPEQIQLIERWLKQGAAYEPHWSLVAPVRPKLPTVKDPSWATGPLDYFILARLDRAGLSPGREADRYALARRLSLDLRGLPPSPEEVEAFVHDERPDAYERLVDRFLADPAYGERWARMWLDLARYADSRGYGSDPLRPNAWRFRDWVID